MNALALDAIVDEWMTLLRPAGLMLLERRRTNGPERRLNRLLPRGRPRLFALPREAPAFRSKEIETRWGPTVGRWRDTPRMIAIPAGARVRVLGLWPRIAIWPPDVEPIRHRWGRL